MILKKLYRRAQKSHIGIISRKIWNTSNLLIYIKTFGRSKENLRFRQSNIWMQGSHYRPDFYKTLDVHGEKFINLITVNCRKDEKILDLCCNQGRFLLELSRRGYSRLFGFDIMSTAIKLLQAHPDYNPQKITVENCLAQEYLKKSKDSFFDWAITYGATIELIHPEFDIFRELGRVVKKGLIFFIHENGHTYPRFYRYLIRRAGFKNICAMPADDGVHTMLHAKKY